MERNGRIQFISTSRGLRGGSFFGDSGSLNALARSSGDLAPEEERYFLGFRVARPIPEPSTVLLLCIGVLGVAALGRRHSA